MYIREAAVDAVVADGELLVIDTKQMHHGGVDIVAGRRISAIKWFVAPLITFARSHAALDATAAEPVGEDIRIVVTTFATLGAWHATKLGGPEDDRIIEQTTLFQIKD